MDYVASVVQVAVQLGRRDGRRTIADIVFRPGAGLLSVAESERGDSSDRT
jgi:hypothetical protein